MSTRASSEQLRVLFVTTSGAAHFSPSLPSVDEAVELLATIAAGAEMVAAGS
jgi:hypothetical protein